MIHTTERAALLGRLEQIYKRDSRQWIVVSFLMMFFFGGGALYFIISEGRMETWVYVVLLAFLACFFMLIRGVRRSNPYNIDAIQQIRSGNVVWIYPENTDTRYGTSYNVKFQATNGKLYTIPTARYEDQEDMVERLANQFPDAALGYDDETRKTMNEHFRK